ncbi:TAP-like protein-domain-containing protein [Mycena vitilis]|nr:TAP-like protein-domain-containing protein [Mycena vitilis]
MFTRMCASHFSRGVQQQESFGEQGLSGCFGQRVGGVPRRSLTPEVLTSALQPLRRNKRSDPSLPALFRAGDHPNPSLAADSVYRTTTLRRHINLESVGARAHQKALLSTKAFTRRTRQQPATRYHRLATHARSQSFAEQFEGKHGYQNSFFKDRPADECASYVLSIRYGNTGQAAAAAQTINVWLAPYDSNLAVAAGRLVKANTQRLRKALRQIQPHHPSHPPPPHDFQVPEGMIPTFWIVDSVPSTKFMPPRGSAGSEHKRRNVPFNNELQSPPIDVNTHFIQLFPAYPLSPYSSDVLRAGICRAPLGAERDEIQILKYLTTDNVAPDMKLITQEFGFEKLKYYGSRRVDVDAWFNRRLCLARHALAANINQKSQPTIEATEADKALQSFFDGCAAAGPDLCAFYEPIAAAIADTCPRHHSRGRAYGIVDYSLLRYTIFETLYSPYAQFSMLAQGLADLQKDNGTVLDSILTTIPGFEGDCNQTSVFSPIDDSTTTILPERCEDIAEFLAGSDRINCAYIRHNRPQNRFSNRVESWTVLMSGRGWKVYRDDRFKGPVGGNTSFPLLLISNTADPVAPRAGGLSTQADFPGSVLLTQNSTGHVSVSAPSLCTLGYIRAYFLNGKIPAPGTVCQVDATLLEPSANLTAKREMLDEDDRRVLAASRVIRDSVLPVIMRKRRKHKARNFGREE